MGVSGAQGGYAAAVEAIARGLSSAAAAGMAGQVKAKEHASQLMLSVLNRTSSGFAAFEEVLRLFDCLDVVVISPDSAAAHPLEVAVLAGCALGRAHTRYVVRQADGCGEPLVTVDAEFSFQVPTALLGGLTEVPGQGQAWAAEEISAFILLR